MTTATISDQIALLEEKEQRLVQEGIDGDELNLVRNRLSELRYTLGEQKQAEQDKKERIEAAIVQTAETVDTLELLPGLTLRDVITDPEAYQLVSIAFKTQMNEKDKKYISELTEISNKHKAELRAADEREANLQYQLKSKDQNIDELNQEATELRKQANTLTFERDEAYKVRDNASNELEGLKLVLEEKDKHIDTLRAEMAVGAKGAQQVDQTEQLKKAHEEWINSRIKVTNIRWADDIKQRDYNAELVENGETITFNRLEKGKYLEVSAEEADRFRAEAAKTVEVPAADITLVEPLVTVPEIEQADTFRQETGPIVDEGHQVADEQHSVQLPTAEEIYRRIQALEAGQAELKGRVDALQQRVVA